MMTVFLFIPLSACDKYKSSYSAVGLVRGQTSHSCEASFFTLKGGLVFKIKKSDKGTEGDVCYSIQVDEGELRLYYDIYGVKEQLACVKAGESVESRGGYVEGGKSVYIIIEAVEKTQGKISVELDN